MKKMIRNVLAAAVMAGVSGGAFAADGRGGLGDDC